MCLLLVCLPLLGFCIAAGCGRWIGARGAAVITTSCLFLSFLLSVNVFVATALHGQTCALSLSLWIQSELFDARWGFLFDTLTSVMLCVITSISSLVHLYSISYMSEDPHLPRFMSYLSLFTFFMLMLVTGDTLFQLFFGWEGVGLASYLLINFWFTRLQANKASIKAMLMNRVGDFGLALGIFALFQLLGTTQYTVLFACAPHYADATLLFCGYEFHALTLIGILLFIGACGKSAQLGLHTWLPDAMEGPTPVSALIHAATMVTAGVFLLARCSPLYEHSPTALAVVTIVGAMTAFFAATTGVVQNDMKRVIAYSTCSQLGYMVFACGLSQYNVAVFHLMTHAFFKALLFLSAGAVIHALNDEQDVRKMGRAIALLPLTYAMLLLGSLALVGFPYLSGFYSKDAILEVAYAHYSLPGSFAFFLGILSAACTAYYSTRVLLVCFLGPLANGHKMSYANAHDAPLLMAIPLILLGFGSIGVGYVAKEAFLGVGSSFFGNALYIAPQNDVWLEAEFAIENDRPWIKLLPLGVTLLGGLVAWMLNSVYVAQSVQMCLSSFGYSVYLFLNRRWLVDKVYNDWIGMPLLRFGYTVSFKTLDKGVFEYVGPTGLMTGFTSLLNPLRAFQSGRLYDYALVMLVSLGVLLAFFSYGASLSTLFGMSV